MNDLFFDDVFRTTTDFPPFDYQCRLACGPEASPQNRRSLQSGTACKSQLINIPTGLGKTAAVVFAWLWNRVLCPDEESRDRWPRRLVYCLPMRTLVEQTAAETAKWMSKLHRTAEELGLDARAKEELGWLIKHSPVLLMGGEELDEHRRAWDLYPERAAVIIGTQDMVLSRALNRGYGMSRYRWPMHFGLLNNDSLYVFDEVQLMGAGIPTTAQLAQFRQDYRLVGASATWWMSATLQGEWLKTIDFDAAQLGEPIRLTEKDCAQKEVSDRCSAPKPIKEAANAASDTKRLADEVVSESAIDALTLVVVNTVERACALHKAVVTAQRKAKSNLPPPVLIHSRFRSEDRKRRVDELLASAGIARIVISTQVVEAGVDVSAKVLFTELAPWSSLVQRFGRCNRRGKFTDASVRWISLDPAKLSAPYAEAELTRAVGRLRGIEVLPTGAAPANLNHVPLDAADGPSISHVLRRKDFVELFDTTPDLAGNEIDVERYIRDADERSVQAFWRGWEQLWEGQAPPTGSPAAAAPQRHELCPVPVGGFREFIQKGGARTAFEWDFLERQWQKADPQRLIPGQSYLLHYTAGGYSSESGWTPDSNDPVIDLRRSDDTGLPEANDSEALSELQWDSVAGHTDKVVAVLEQILQTLTVEQRDALEVAARWHDRGKAHKVFQGAVLDDQDGRERPAPWRSRRDVAKAPGKSATGGSWWTRYQRKHFRHEFASALAVLHPNAGLDKDQRDLIAYLVAAHHGKVRLSLRSLPNECQPEDSRRFARGVWQDDDLPEVDLGGGVLAPSVVLSLEPMELGECVEEPFVGESSWIERTLRLRDRLGPFRLSYFEALLRAADERASGQTIMSVPVSRAES
jgi:CRISPR-associated endonuclease/helicase Cas3